MISSLLQMTSVELQPNSSFCAQVQSRGIKVELYTSRQVQEVQERQNRGIREEQQTRGKRCVAEVHEHSKEAEACACISWL